MEQVATYSADVIRNLHSQSKAVMGKYYKDPSGTLYVGRADGRLKPEHVIDGEIINTSLSSQIKGIGDYSREDILLTLGASDKKWVELEDFETYKKEAKCFTMAMSIAL